MQTSGHASDTSAAGKYTSAQASDTSATGNYTSVQASDTSRHLYLYVRQPIRYVWRRQIIGMLTYPMGAWMYSMGDLTYFDMCLVYLSVKLHLISCGYTISEK